MIKKIIKNSIAPLRKLKRKIRLKSISRDLSKLAHFYATDKVSSHSYIQHYEHHLGKFRNKNIKLLEIGVGGYSNPLAGGNSLRMWKRYFSKGEIFSLDIYNKSALEEDRIKIFEGSQVDTGFLDKVTKATGPFDVIIDDGSHINEHVIKSFEFLFPKLKDGGIYIVEDTQTSYWPEYGGDSSDLKNSKTLMNYFKNLTDCLNHVEFIHPGYEKSFFDKKIVSMHFYHNLIFIYKGDNDEISNILVNNELAQTSFSDRT